jgi:diguanylate cyclase (GGDEF)-like protein
MTTPNEGQQVAPPVDFVTGLESRSALEDLLRKVTADPAEQIAILGVDLVGLKDVNETAGFLAGDSLLAEAAATLRAATSAATMQARLGGDELVAVFTGVAASAAAKAAQDALEMARRPAIRCGMIIRQPDEPPQQLVERLYAAIRSA